MRRTPLLGLLVGLSLLAGACSGAKQPSASELQKKVSTQLRDQYGSLTRSQADCYARLVVAKVGRSTINKIAVTDKDPDAATKKALAAASIEATSRCHIPASTTTTTTTATTATTATPATTSTTAP